MWRPTEFCSFRGRKIVNILGVVNVLGVNICDAGLYNIVYIGLNINWIQTSDWCFFIFSFIKLVNLKCLNISPCYIKMADVKGVKRNLQRGTFWKLFNSHCCSNCCGWKRNSKLSDSPVFSEINCSRVSISQTQMRSLFLKIWFFIPFGL